MIRVALAGCGVVGSELLRLIREQALNLAREDGIRLEIVRVLVRRPEAVRDVAFPRDRFTGDHASFLAVHADVVVEAMGGTSHALKLARRTLEQGRRFVTANKALLAAHGPELAALALRHGGSIDFEAAVGGGVPVVRALRDSLASSGVIGLRGILNGTTNYILTRVAEGTSFADALARAKHLGFAESDPARDLSGEDSADKIAVLGWVAFGTAPETIAIRTRGIVKIADRLAADARAFNGVPRLVAEVRRLPEGLAAAVEPCIVSADSELGRTNDERNIVLLETRWNGSIVLSGPGAGGQPTAAVLLADIRRAARALAPACSTAPPSVAESQKHRWAVSIRRTPGVAYDLRAHLQEAGLRAEKVEVDSAAGVVRAALEAVPWQKVERLSNALTDASLQPVVSRFELGR
ncbi:MAG: homoserine dehydrogenase [Gemmatimonadetes bacterium]|nr:homoserine dehydrogenase [Gemmatimonadota bacterium]